MKILFIHCNINTANGPHFLPGVATISSVLKAAGHAAALLFLQEEMPKPQFLERVRDEAPDLIGFSTVTNQWPFILRYTRWLREETRLPIIHGGIHVTVDAEEAIRCPEVDLLCVGEGEYPLLELAGCLETGRPYTAIANLWCKLADGGIIRNPLRPLLQDLDALPLPDRSLFDYPWLLRTNRLDAAIVMAGRGCPFSCSYCGNNTLHKLYRGLGRYVRLRSPERVLEEARIFCRDYPIQHLVFLDDTFTYNPSWLKRFCAGYRAEIGLPFTAHVRVDALDESRLRLLKEAGCETMIAGVESGNERIRREIMKRKISQEQIIRVFHLADRLGIKTRANYMLGLPTETPEAAEDTLALNEIIRPNYAQVAIFYPYPGTELHALCGQQGLLSGRDNTSFLQGESILAMTAFTREQILHYYQVLKASACRIQAEKEQQGDYDFMARLADARISSEQAGWVQLTRATISGEERLAIFAHPESKISYQVEWQGQASLAFGCGLSPEVWSPEKGWGVDFEIKVKSGGREILAFSRLIDPKHCPEDGKWHDFELHLPELPAGPAAIHLITTTRGRPNHFCWALWSRPFLRWMH